MKQWNDIVHPVVLATYKYRGLLKGPEQMSGVTNELPVADIKVTQGSTPVRLDHQEIVYGLSLFV